MTIIMICITFSVVLAAVLYNLWQTTRERDSLQTMYVEAAVENSRMSEYYERNIDELKHRDQVESYNALEQGMNELQEAYEVDRLDLVEKIGRLELENNFMKCQMDDTIDELTGRLETYKRAQQLHIDTILNYEQERLARELRDGFGV